MPLLRVEAEKLSNNELVAGVITEIIDKEDLFAILPFMKVNSKAYVYEREKTLSEAEFLDPYDTVPEGAATFTEVVAKLRILAGDVDIDNFLDETMSDTNDQTSIQIAKKAKGLARKFKRTLAIGDSGANAKEFDGVDKLVDASKRISVATNGASLSFSMLDELLDAVPNGADVIMMRSEHIRALRALLRASGGLEPAHVMMEDFGRPMLTHNGVPIIVNDFLPNDATHGTATDCAPIYALRANELDGLHGIYGGSAAGVRVENIGTVQDKDSTRIRLKWYASVCLKSTQSLAVLDGVRIG